MSTDLGTKNNKNVWTPEENKALLKCHKCKTIEEAVILVNEVSNTHRSTKAVASNCSKRGIKLLAKK